MLSEMVQRKYVHYPLHELWELMVIPLTRLEYLRGNTSSNECEDLFTKYRTCLNVNPLSSLYASIYYIWTCS